jgi:UDP-N-acetyl-D-mannosaminuronic acid dehydrogenase
MRTDYDVLIIGGLGHVGLPLGIMLADAGLQVGLYDIDTSSKRDMVAQGIMPFLEYDSEPILARTIGKTLHLVDLHAAASSNTIIITVGTPVDEYLNPKLLPIFKVADQLLPFLRQDHHLVLRSTVFPGTTSRLDDYFVEHGKRVHLSFCPERIAQGYAVRELRKLPQIISGVSPEACEESRALFERLGCETLDLPVLEAELAKLFSNSWRYIQFAIANQFFMMAEENGADFGAIHHAMTYNYERATDFPKPGFAAGPCLLKDTMQLSAFRKNTFMLGHAAMLINEGLPAFIVDSLKRTCELKHETVGILGMAFKGNVDDIRDSLAYKLGKLLRFEGAKVLYTDEFAVDPTFISKEELVARSSIVILAAPHSAYRQLDIPPSVQLVDVWGFFPERRAAGDDARAAVPALAELP